MLLPQLRGGLVLATFIRTLYISKKNARLLYEIIQD